MSAASDWKGDQKEEEGKRCISWRERAELIAREEAGGKLEKEEKESKSRFEQNPSTKKLLEINDRSSRDSERRKERKKVCAEPLITHCCAEDYLKGERAITSKRPWCYNSFTRKEREDSSSLRAAPFVFFCIHSSSSLPNRPPSFAWRRKEEESGVHQHQQSRSIDQDRRNRHNWELPSNRRPPLYQSVTVAKWLITRKKRKRRRRTRPPFKLLGFITNIAHWIDRLGCVCVCKLWVGKQW